MVFKEQRISPLENKGDTDISAHPSFIVDLLDGEKGSSSSIVHLIHSFANQPRCSVNGNRYLHQCSQKYRRWPTTRRLSARLDQSSQIIHLPVLMDDTCKMAYSKKFNLQDNRWFSVVISGHPLKAHLNMLTFCRLLRSTTWTSCASSPTFPPTWGPFSPTWGPLKLN